MAVAEGDADRAHALDATGDLMARYLVELETKAKRARNEFMGEVLSNGETREDFYARYEAWMRDKGYSVMDWDAHTTKVADTHNRALMKGVGFSDQRIKELLGDENGRQS